jgi:cytoskeletal protein CcmA (bactofilin family)
VLELELIRDSQAEGRNMFSNKRTDGIVGVASENSYEQPASSAVRANFSYDKGRSSNHSIIDECLTMKGDLESEGDILVKGKVLGNIKCKMLIVDADALVEGGVEAEEVIIRGNSKGTIKANRVRLEKTATVDSDICHQTFSAEEGARIKGALRFKDDPFNAEPEETNIKPLARAAKPANSASVTAIQQPTP